MKYLVIAECVDARSGKRFLPGEPFDPAPDPDQAKRLIGAGAIVEDDSDGSRRLFLAVANDENGAGMKLLDLSGYRFAGFAIAIAAPTDPDDFDWKAIEADPGETGILVEPETDGLDELLVPALKDLVEKEAITIERGANKAAIIAAIRAKRLELAGAGEPKPEDDGLDALDDAGLVARLAELGITIDAGADRAATIAAIRAHLKAA